MKQFLQRVPRYAWVLAVIVLVGIFLRTYHFQSQLRFNNDQARDATVVSNALIGKTALPLLGPLAGGTSFKLGPAFYYFEIASAKLFGNYPDRLAYPDLVSSILAILLLFFFLRLYFSKGVSLTLTFLFAVSFYGVHYSRFAWNPNSMPFWTLLYIFSLLKFFGPSRIPKSVWAMLAGLALGIGVQLHTLLLGIMPFYLVSVFAWAILRKTPVKKYFAILLIIAFVLNIPQVINEYNTSWSNTRHFLTAQKIKQSGNKSLVQSSVLAVSCTAQADAFILTGLGNPDSCAAGGKKPADDNIFLLRLGIGLALLLGGGLILYGKIREENDPARKNFLIFAGAYGLLYLLIFIPIIQGIADKAMRYYLGMVLVPFVLLGLGLEFLIENLKENSWLWIGLVVIIFSASNLAAVRNELTLSKLDVSIFTLGEGENMARYIASQTGSSHQALIAGSSAVMFHEFKPLQVLANNQGLALERYKAKKSSGTSEKIFSIAFSPGTNGRTFGQRFGRFIMTEQTSPNGG
jgi:4-amino-4-deoxy-L-arabinose transferase-like glycosyltransferase